MKYNNIRGKKYNSKKSMGEKNDGETDNTVTVGKLREALGDFPDDATLSIMLLLQSENVVEYYFDLDFILKEIKSVGKLVAIHSENLDIIIDKLK